MPLPPNVDKQVRQRFNDLIDEASVIIKDMERDNVVGHERARRDGIAYMGEIHYQKTAYHALATKAISLVGLILGKTDRANQIISDIHEMSSGSSATKKVLGILHGLKDDYESGMLASLPEMIEANVVADYMGQAEQLLGEGIIGQFDYVPATVLAGAVLEDALRRLCERQIPPIDTLKPNGDKKTLDPLITDLQKANVFNKARADMLKSWAKTRNYAAHGEFVEFNRTDVEAMILGVKAFIADYL